MYLLCLFVSQADAFLRAFHHHFLTSLLPGVEIIERRSDDWNGEADDENAKYSAESSNQLSQTGDRVDVWNKHVILSGSRTNNSKLNKL